MTVLPWEGLQPLRDPPSALSIGVFDGIHLGHQALIREIVSGTPGTVPVVCSFRPNPASVLGTRPVGGSILSWGQKRRRFEALGIRYLVLIDFSLEISRLSGADFLTILQRAFDVRRLVVGYNFHMGRGRDTGIRELESLLGSAATQLTVVPAAYHRNRVVSSSRIREDIVHGRFRDAREMLGQDYCLDLEEAGPPAGRGPRLDRERIRQILPAPGSYRAELRGEGPPREARVIVRADAVEWDPYPDGRFTEICFRD